MRQIPVIIHIDKIEISEYWRKVLRQAVKDNGKPIRAIIDPLMPESRNQRRYLMGCLIPILVYLDGNDYKDTKTKEYYFEHYKKEFAPELIKINGKIQTFGKSTKGSKALNNFIEKVQEHLDEQYAIPYDSKATNPEEYKKFRDEIYPFQNEYDDWIDFCVQSKWIRKPIV
jgi:hypothetical protein